MRRRKKKREKETLRQIPRKTWWLEGEKFPYTVNVETTGAWKNHTGIDAGARACARAQPSPSAPSVKVRVFKKMAIAGRGTLNGCGSNWNRGSAWHGLPDII